MRHADKLKTDQLVFIALESNTVSYEGRLYLSIFLLKVEFFFSLCSCIKMCDLFPFVEKKVT